MPSRLRSRAVQAVCRLLLLALWAPEGFAASEALLRGMRHASWTERDGAPHGIHALAQTPDGYLWIGAAAGLFRFDGARFTTFIPPADSPQFNSLDISVLAADAEGGLWIGFRVGGISYLRSGRLTNYDSASGLTMEYVDQLLPYSGGVMAVTGGRLLKLAGSRWRDLTSELGLPPMVQSVFIDRSGNHWIAAEHHVYILRQGESKASPTAETVKAVTQFLETPGGRVLISDAWRSVRQIAGPSLLPEHRLRGASGLLFDADGYLWIANDYWGLDVLRYGAQQVPREHFGQKDGLTSDECRAILEDREGNIWIGTGLGLDRFQHSAFAPFTDIPLRSYPGLAAGMDGDVWVASWGNPILRVQNGATKSYGEKRGWGVIHREPGGAVWLFDYWGARLGVAQGGDFKPIRLPPQFERQVVQAIASSGVRQETYFAFENDGLWNRRNEEWSRIDIPGENGKPPLSLLVDSSERLWAGFADGRVGLLERGHATSLAVGGASSLGSVMTLYEQGGRIWAGGTNGLAIFTGNGFRRLVPVEGIALRGISGIVQSRDQDLWLNSASGIVRLLAAELERGLHDPNYRVQAEVFDFRDGVSGVPAQLRPTPTAVADSTGRLWFATAGNVFSIDPASVRLQHSPPHLVIESLRSDGTERRIDGLRKISIGSRNLEIDYVGISLASPQRVAYRYKLEGEDKDWQQAGVRRQALYTALRPGRYRFSVAASIGDGRWTQIELPADIVVPPAFYQSTWFLTACVLAAIACLGIGHKLRVQHVTSRVQERLEERTAERVRIARDLHDTLLQGLQGLLLRFHFATERIPEEEPARRMMEDALDVADRVVEEGRNRVKALRAAFSEHDLANALAQVGAELNWRRSVRFSVSTEGSPATLPPMMEAELYFIGREAISNAFLHANATEIRVEISSDGNLVWLRCRDDGCGLDEQAVQRSCDHGHWGLIGMRERAEKISARFECWSAPGKGTEITVTVSSRFRRASDSTVIRRLFKGRETTHDRSPAE